MNSFDSLRRCGRPLQGVLEDERMGCERAYPTLPGHREGFQYVLEDILDFLEAVLDFSYLLDFLDVS